MKKYIITISFFFLLVNCKNRKISHSENCIPFKECILNITVIDSNLENEEVIAFFGIADISKKGNGVDTDIDGNGTVVVKRPLTESIPLEMRYMGIRDTFYAPITDCKSKYQISYYLPEWFSDSLKSKPKIEIKPYNSDTNY